MKTPIFPFLVFVFAALLVFAEDRQAEEQRIAAFFQGIPHEISVPEKDLKTYLIDATTYKVVRSFDGVFRDYWDDEDIILTESGRIVYVRGDQELDAQPENDDDDVERMERTILTLWNRSTGQKIRSFESWESSEFADRPVMKCLGRTVMLTRFKGWDEEQPWALEFWDLETGRMSASLPGAFAFLSEEHSLLITKMWNRELRTWNPYTFEPLDTFPGDRFSVSADCSRIVVPPGPVYDTDGEVTLAAWPANTIVYDLKTGKKLQTFPYGTRAEFSPDGSLVLIRDDLSSNLSLHEIDSGRERWCRYFPGRHHFDFTFYPDLSILHGECLFFSLNVGPTPKRYLWNLRTGKETASERLDYIPNSRRFLDDGMLRDFDAGTPIGPVSGSFQAATPHGRRFLTSERHSVYLWDSETGECLQTFESKFIDPDEKEVDFNAEGNRVRTTTKNDRMDSPYHETTFLWDAETGEMIRRIDATQPNALFHDIVWKTDGTNAVFWNTTDNRPFLRIKLTESRRFRDNTIGPIRFLDDGNQLLFSTKRRPILERGHFF